jgi:diadenosine tetraphosphatase ApaH/serine/threonine PP2A family protein phosphatase
MRILVLSDIHANITALEAVLADAKEFDAVWCLGDILGYGPDPNECVNRIRELPIRLCMLGNHDAAVIGKMDLASFNYDARMTVEWMQNILTSENMDFISCLPEKEVFDDVTLVHGSPRNPIWEYILDWHTALINFDYFETRFCFVGHTHLPILYQMKEGQSGPSIQMLPANHQFKLEGRMIINPGSVGQPRDRDPRAAYAIFDSNEGTWQEHRVVYDVEFTQKRMTQSGLPERNALRLTEGW